MRSIKERIIDALFEKNFNCAKNLLKNHLEHFSYDEKIELLNQILCTWQFRSV